MKKNYRELLADQINQKHHQNAVDREVKVRQQEAFTKITYTPQELDRFNRDRKNMEIQKYKEDLDQSSPAIKGSRMRERSLTGPELKNDFNTSQIEHRHNPMLNPMPYNIQNPYILREMRQKELVQSRQPF